MPREKSAGAVIFRREDGEVSYLLLHYKYKIEYLGFPRGNIEEGEAEKETVRREIAEETALEEIKFIPGFRETARWFYRREGKTIAKEAVFYLVEAVKGDVKISAEHIGFKWMTFKEALANLRFENDKKVLKKAEEFLKGIF